MRSLKPLVFLFLCCCFCAISQAGDKKKEMIVVAGQAAQRVNNHPWSYTTPGSANTTCSGNGTVNATGTTYGNATDINGTINTTTDCNTTYRPPTTTSGNRVTVDNAAWVTDVSTGDSYLIQCTANWVGSKCSYIGDGRYKAALEGNTMWITGMKGMKQMTAKYHVIRFVPGSSPAATTAASTTSAQSVGYARNWSEEEKFTWQWYQSMPEEERNYVREFCTANPNDRALLPHAKVLAGEQADRALSCSAWVGAKTKL